MDKVMSITLEGWEELAEFLIRAGEPWPAPAVTSDLHWWVLRQTQDRGRGVPSVTRLARRWCWTESQVVALLEGIQEEGRLRAAAQGKEALA